MEDLSQLPPEILVEIARRLKKLEDFTSFRSVSKSLHASAKMEYFEGLRLRQQTPYLMYPVRDDGNDDDVRELYSLVEGESTVASLKVPNFKNKKCLESLGWLLVSEVDGRNSLLDPFSGTEIPLPHQNTFPGYEMVAMDVLAFFSKMVLSSRPSETSDFVLMVIGGGLGHLAYWRLGDKAWNRIKERPGSYSDLVYNGDGQFYAFSHPAVVYGFNLSTSDNQIESRIVTYFMSESERVNLESVTYVNVLVATKRVYLLKTIDDSLLIITRTAPELSPDGASYITSQFQVYEVDTETGKWKEIHSLGRMAVFVGLNSTIAVDATRHPGRVFKANRIYFTDDDWEFYYFQGLKGGGMDCGVYDLETGIIEPLYPGEPLFNKVSPSIWITPCF